VLGFGMGGWAWLRARSLVAVVCAALLASGLAAVGPVRAAVASSSSGGQIVSVPSARIMDTRNGTGTTQSPLAGGTTRQLTVVGAGGVPSGGVSAVVLSVGSTNATAAGYLLVWPAGATQPSGSTLNTATGTTVTNTTVVPVGTNGQVSITASYTTDVFVDVEGYVTSVTAGSAGNLFTPVALTRIMDTRSGLGGRSTPLGAASTVSLTVGGVTPVPVTATAVMVNVTAVSPTAGSYLQAWPAGGAQPAGGSLNDTSGVSSAHTVVVGLGAGGAVSLYNAVGSVNVLVDVEGYFTSASSPSGSYFTAETDARIMDTRSKLGGSGTLGAGATATLQVSGAGGVPSGATAAAVSITTLNVVGAGFLEAYQAGTTRPNPASTVTTTPGVTSNNFAIVPLSSSGQMAIYNASTSTDVLVDVQGYFLPVSVPGAPTGVSAAAQDSQAVVSWTPPVVTGGTGIASYTVTASPGGATASSSVTTATVTGLTDGTPYTFTVTATNGSPGHSAASAPSAAVTPQVPAPAWVRVIPRNGAALVTWAAAASPPGARGITGYTVTASSGVLGTSTVTATTSGTTSATVTGLSNEASYRFSVTATNGSATSAPSPASEPATPSTHAGLEVGTVSTLAGSGASTTSAGTGIAAGLGAPTALVYAGGDEYVGGADYIAQVVVATGAVTILAGAPGTPGCANGTGGAARVSGVTTLTTDGTNLYATDACGIQQLAIASQAVTTLSGFGSGWTQLVPAGAGTLYGIQAGAAQPTVYQLNVAAQTYAPFETPTMGTCGGGGGANQAQGLAVDNGTIYELVQVGSCLSVIEQYVVASGAASALFQSPELSTGPLFAQGGMIYTRAVPDGCAGNGGCTPANYGPRVAEIAESGGNVWSFVAGAGINYADGTGADAWFKSVAQISGNPSDGTLFVADTADNRLREIVPASSYGPAQDPAAGVGVPITVAQVASLAGGTNPVTTAGSGTAISFDHPSAITAWHHVLYVGTHDTILRIDPTQSPVTATVLAGTPGSAGTQDGTNGATSQVQDVSSLVTDGRYLYSIQQGLIRRTSMLTGATSTLGPYVQAGNVGQQSLAIGPDGMLYVANAVGDVGGIEQVDPITGAATTITLGAQTAQCGFTILSITADATTLWAVEENVGCDGYLQSPYVEGYSLATWQPVASVGIKVPYNPVPDYALNNSAAITAVAGQLDVSFQGYNWSSQVNNICWATQLYSVNPFTSISTPLAGNTTPVTDSGGTSCDFAPVPGSTFTGNSEMTSDGSTLYTAGFSSKDDEVMAVTQAPPPPAFLLTFPGGPTLPGELVGGTNLAQNTNCSICTGEPVDTATGALVEQVSDVTMAGRGQPPTFIRTYDSSASGVAGSLGYGWTDNYAWHLAVNGTTGAVTITQGNGSTTAFAVNGSTYQAAPRVEATLTKGTSTWTYVVKGRMTYTFILSTGATNGDLASQSTPNGDTLTLAYDASARLSTVTDSAGRTLTFGYNAASLISSVTDLTGRSVSYLYDASHNLHQVTDVDGKVWLYGYTGHLLSTVEDPMLQTTTTLYTNGKVSSQQDAALNTPTRYAFSGPNAAGYSTVLVTHPLGNQDLYTYQNNELILQTKGYGTAYAATTQYVYDPGVAEPDAVIDPLGATSLVSYDAAGNAIGTQDPLGYTTSATYNSFGEKTSATDADGNTTVWVYDTQGDLRQLDRPLVTSGGVTWATTTFSYDDPTHPGDVTAMVSPNGNVTQYTYDGYGDQIAMIDPLGRKSTATYNALGWVTSTVSPAGYVAGGTPAQYTTLFSKFTGYGKPLNITDPGGHLTQYKVNSDQLVTDVIDPDGYDTSTSYTKDNQVSNVVVLKGSGSGNSTSYDANGNIVTESNGAKVTTATYTYDPLDRPQTVKDGGGRVTSYTYDLDSHPLTTTRPTATGTMVTTYGYDAVGHLTGIAYSDGTTHAVAYTYTPGGRRVTMADSTGTTRYVYDTLGRLTSVSDGGGHTVTYGYDLDNNTTSIAYTSTQAATYTYDAADEMHTAQDWLGGGKNTFTYAPDGQLQSTAYANGVLGTNTYDVDDLLTGITYTNGATTLAQYAYTPTLAGRLATATPSNGAAGAAQTFAYTPNAQLSSTTGSTTTQWSYNPAGDITSTSTGTSLGYDPTTDELTTATPSSGPVTTFSFDPTGRRTSSTVTGASAPTTYTYDQADNLTAYITPAGATSTYTYNGDGLRATKTPAGGGQQSLAWDTHAGSPLLLSDGTNAYIYGPEGRPVEQITGSTAQYLHQDANGSTVLLTTTAGATAGTYSYDSYGTVATHTGGTAGLTWQGQYQDSDSGLYYLRARMYDPATGQFLTIDPLVAATRDPYGYAREDPANGSDPTGLWCILGHNPDGSCRGSNEYNAAVTQYDPVSWVINGYVGEWEAAEAGCPWYVDAEYGTEGVLGLAATATLAFGGAEALVGASDTAAAETELPSLSASRSALEAKFKHAGDFGVTEPRGAAGFGAYGKAVDAFVQDSGTTRVVGSYRGDSAILNYNANTAQVVVQAPDGTFISGWQMSPAQLQNVIERGSLGGG